MNEVAKKMRSIVNKVKREGRDRLTDDEFKRFKILREQARKIPLDPGLSSRQRAILNKLQELADLAMGEGRGLAPAESETCKYLLDALREADAEAGLTPEEEQYAGSVKHQKLSNRRMDLAGARATVDRLSKQPTSGDHMYKTWEAEDAAEERSDRVAEIKTTANLNRNWLFGNGYVVLLNAIDSLTSKSSLYEIERTELGLNDAVWLLNQRRCGVVI